MSECAILASILLVCSLNLVFMATVFFGLNEIRMLLEGVYEAMKAAQAGKDVTK